jgi:predicted DNA-binding protein (MmcQ/YjbR family)
MVDLATLRKLAFAFEGVTEQPHFEKTSFRTVKKIFATFDEKHNRACLKLPVNDQNVFCLVDQTVIYPVPNKWGAQGWTLIELGKVRKDVLKHALTIAYNETAKKKIKSNQNLAQQSSLGRK